MGYESRAVTGVTNHYGPRKTHGEFGGEYITEGSIKETVIRIRYNEIPTGGSAKSPIIPALATIIDAKLKVKTAFASGTSYTLGTYKASDGTAVDADGLITAVNAATANINAAGKVVTGSGAQIGASVGADDVRLGMVADGTYTAGYGEIVVRWTPAPPTPTA